MKRALGSGNEVVTGDTKKAKTWSPPVVRRTTWIRTYMEKYFRIEYPSGSISAYDEDEYLNAFFYSVVRNDIEGVVELLEAMTESNQNYLSFFDDDGNTFIDTLLFGCSALHVAAILDYPQMVDVLCSRNADVNMVSHTLNSYYDESALFWSLSERDEAHVFSDQNDLNEQVIGILVRHGAEVLRNIPKFPKYFTERRCALHKAIEFNFFKAARDILKLHPDLLNMSCDSCYGIAVDTCTPLQVAVYAWRDLDTRDIIKLLVDNGADIDQLRHDGLTLFGYAVKDWQYDLAKYLLSLGCNINAIIRGDENALLYCFRYFTKKGFGIGSESERSERINFAEFLIQSGIETSSLSSVLEQMDGVERSLMYERVGLDQKWLDIQIQKRDGKTD